jgi:hypothetical protein
MGWNVEVTGDIVDQTTKAHTLVWQVSRFMFDQGDDGGIKSAIEGSDTHNPSGCFMSRQAPSNKIVSEWQVNQGSTEER